MLTLRSHRQHGPRGDRPCFARGDEEAENARIPATVAPTAARTHAQREQGRALPDHERAPPLLIAETARDRARSRPRLWHHFHVMPASDHQLVRALVHDASVYLQSHGPDDDAREKDLRHVQAGIALADRILAGNATDKEKESVADFVAREVRTLYLS